MNLDDILPPVAGKFAKHTFLSPIIRMDSEYYFRPANGLLYLTTETKDGGVVATDDGLQDGWASEDKPTLLEEPHKFQGNLRKDIGPTTVEEDSFRASTMLTASFARTLALRVESVVLRCIQHQFQIADPLLLKISIRGPIIVLLAHLMLTTFKEVLLGFKALLMLLGCACLICNSF